MGVGVGGLRSAGLFQARVQPRSGASGHEGTDYFNALKDVAVAMGQLWLLKKTSLVVVLRTEHVD